MSTAPPEKRADWLGTSGNWGRCLGGEVGRGDWEHFERPSKVDILEGMIAYMVICRKVI